MSGMRPLAALLLLLASCSSSIGDSPAGTPDGRPITFRSPPESKVGSGSAPGCEGVAARGECRDGTLVFCDLEVGKAKKVDCTATRETCAESVSRGAACIGHGESDPNPSASGSPCTSANVSEAGFCTSDGAAKYCDTTGESPKVRTWKCADNNKSCVAAGEPGACAEHTFCCGGEETTDCGSLTFEGVCEGEVAKWCGTDGVQQKLNCAARGQLCVKDDCASGNYCCGATEDTAECQELGYEGVCLTDSTVRYCAGDMNTDIREFTCADGFHCREDEYGAECREKHEEQPDQCAEVNGPDGICDGDTLKYCLGGVYKEKDCTVSARSCEVGTCLSGMANCCE